MPGRTHVGCRGLVGVSIVGGWCCVVQSGAEGGGRRVAVVGVVGGGLLVVRFGAHWGRCGVAWAEECGCFPLEDVVHDVGHWSAWVRWLRQWGRGVAG